MCASIALAVFLTVIEPASSRGLQFPARTAFWLAHVLIPVGFAQIAQVALLGWPRITRASPWFSVTLAGLAGTLAFAPVAVALDAAFPVTQDLKDTTETLRGALIEEFLSLTPPIVLTWAALNATRLLRLTDLPRQTSEPTKPPPGPSFLARVRPEMRGDLVALSAELHYLRVFTTRGEDLVLFGFGQALEELGDTNGLKIHRSHWVNLAYVKTRRKSGGQLTIETTTGVTLPVSRARRRDVEKTLDGLGPL